MRKLLFIPLVSIFLTGCEQPRPVKECITYSEAADPFPDTAAGWDEIKPGLHAALGSVDYRYSKSSIPDVAMENTWNGSGWQGERISAQLALWSNVAVRQIECEFSDFKSGNGKSLPASIAQSRFVRYVITDEFADACGTRKPENYAASLSPDVLDPLDCFDMEAQTTRPVWITINIPADADPGIYKSTLTLFTAGKKHSTFTFNVEVFSRTLPPASEWKFHLDLWQNPYAVARVHNVTAWSDDHWEALRPLMSMLAGAGQKVITATLNKLPWGGQTEDTFESMIEWTKKTDGSWQYDYTIFDNWVQFMMDLGIKSQINCYSMVPWGNALYYYDEKTGEEIMIKAEPGTKDYNRLWTPFLQDFTRHLELKGWKEITRIAMDERGPDEMKAMLKFLNDTAPGLGIAQADDKNNFKQYIDQVHDLCVIQYAPVDRDDIEERRSKGLITTWYVCCANIFPNIFTFSPPAEGAFIGWYTIAAGYDGFLRWAYNSWVKEPLLDSRFRKWPAGDTYAVYPEARSSIRFERLLEGIQDAEKIRILREELEKEGTPEAEEKLKKLNDTVALFNILKNPGNLEELMAKGKQVLEELSR